MISPLLISFTLERKKKLQEELSKFSKKLGQLKKIFKIASTQRDYFKVTSGVNVEFIPQKLFAEWTQL